MARQATKLTPQERKQLAKILAKARAAKAAKQKSNSRNSKTR